MSRPPNAQRGETQLIVGGKARLVRPSFESLVAAEEELGPLFALVERASEGGITLTEITALLWHCMAEPDRPRRDAVGEAVLSMGLVAATQPIRAILGQVMQGQT